MSDSDQLRQHFTMIPNIVMRLELSAYALGLYVHIISTAGWEGGKCWKSSRTLAKELRCSTGTITNAKRELRRKDWRLAFKPLIEIESVPRRYGGKPYHSITPVPIWKENAKHFDERTQTGSTIEHASSFTALASSDSDLASASSEINKSYETISQERKTSEEAAPSLSPSSRETITDAQKSQISEFWNFVQTLFDRNPSERVPRRELRLIRQLLPVPSDEMDLVKWWYSIKETKALYRSPEHRALEWRPRAVGPLLLRWSDIVDMARYFRTHSSSLRGC